MGAANPVARSVQDPAAVWLTRLVREAHATLLTAPAAEPARRYLRRRGVSEQDWVTYQLGYASPTIEIGACTPAFAEWFPRGWFERLVFPLTAPLGGVLGLQTRALDQKSYMQFYAYPTDVFPYMFGVTAALTPIWNTKQIVIVEGVFDYLAVKDLAPNTVAVLTAGVPQACRRFFRRYVKRVTALLDMDDAGREGARRLAGELGAGYIVTIPVYPAHDPAEGMATATGMAALRRVLAPSQRVLP